MRKLISLLSAFVLGITFLSSAFIPAYADEKRELDSLKSKYMVLMDYDSGNVLYQKNADKKMYPASTTKIWTAFCVLKKCKDLNQVIEIKDMPRVIGSSMYLEDGEKFTVKELLESLLIHSSNDVAYVLAKHFGNGKPEKFIEFMNEEAVKYGAKNTHFNNPHGLPDEDHYTTAMDMTMLGRVAYSNNVIKKIVSMKSVSFKRGPNCKLDREMYNSNRFLTSLQTMEYKGKTIPIKYDIVDGMKTGYTDDAGNCLLATAKKDGTRLISGVFKAPGGALYHDSRTLLDYGFDSFKTVTILKKEDFEGEQKVKFAKPSTIHYTLANDYSVTEKKSDNISKDDYKTKMNFENLKLPVKKGDIIGSLQVYRKGSLVSNIALVAENDSMSYWDYALDKISGKKKVEEEPEKEEKVEEPKKEENKAKKVVKDSANGFIGIFSGIKDSFNGDVFKNFEGTDFYKFLDKKVGEKISFVSPKVVIYGVPGLILLIVLILILGIIKDAIKKKREAKRIKKAERRRRKEETKRAKEEAKRAAKEKKNEN